MNHVHASWILFITKNIPFCCCHSYTDFSCTANAWLPPSLIRSMLVTSYTEKLLNFYITKIRAINIPELHACSKADELNSKQLPGCLVADNRLKVISEITCCTQYHTTGSPILQFYLIMGFNVIVLIRLHLLTHWAIQHSKSSLNSSSRTLFSVQPSPKSSP